MMSPSALLGVIALLIRRFHIEDVCAALVFLYQSGEYLLPISLAAQLFGHSKVPEPVERLAGIDNREAKKEVSLVVRREVQRHRCHKAQQIVPRNLFLLGESTLVEGFHHFVGCFGGENALFSHDSAGLPSGRKHDVLHVVGFPEQRRHLLVREACDAAADACDEECQLGMCLGKQDELVHVGTYRFHASLHRRDAVALSLQPYALPHDGSELAVGDERRTSSVHALQVAPEDEDFVWLELRDKRGCCLFPFHILEN